MPRLKSKLFFGFILLLLFYNDSYGQNSLAKTNWYFGNSVYGIRFARPDFTVTLDSTHMAPPFARFGNATANSPETGDLLFYTDGQFVYDANFQLMAGIIAGNPSFFLNADINKNQNTAIVGMPGDNDRYIIFTNTAGNTINYSIVDMTESGNAVFPQPNLGRVTVFNQAIPASTANTSGAMLVVAKSDLSGYWLITGDAGTSDYKVLNINGSDPTAWSELPYNLGNATTAANFSYYPGPNAKIAVAPSSSNTNVQILAFDASAGIPTFDTEILNSGYADLASEAIYDTEWSPDGTKLYISRYGGISVPANIGDVLQWDSTLPSSSSLVSILPGQVFGSYGLQMGPDTTIYHLYQEFNGGPYIVGGIEDADSIPSLVQYTSRIFNDQNFNSHQFPALLPPRTNMLSVDFNAAGTCANTPTTFYPIITPAADSVFWDFGDGSGTSTQLSPFYTYTAASTYNVTLFASLNGQISQATKPVPITAFDLQLSVPSDTVACQCELPKYGPTCTPFSVAAQVSNEPAGTTYLWSNGDTGTILTPDSAGYYYVIATDPISGCSAYAGVNVQEYGAMDQRANVWYFGTRAGIDFNPPATTAIDDGIMDAPEGCTAISDRNGVILFYTDGDNVYIKNKLTGVHTLIDSGLGGDPLSAQAVVAVPFPDDETLYYIFTTEEVGSGIGNYEFKFSVFDLKLNNGDGGIAEKNIPLFSKSTERITANANWVIIHEYGNNNFRAYPITTTGLGSPVVSSMGSDHSTAAAAFGQGYMKFSNGGDKLAVALAESTTGRNYVEVFEWDNMIGEVTDFRRLDLTADGAVGQVYGVEFDPSGVKLFATVQGASSSLIMEYRADSLERMHVLTPIMTSGGQLGAIQIAPTGQVFVASANATSLGVISVNGDTATASTYNPSGFPLAAGRTSQLGLPNFAQNFGSPQMPPSFFVSSPVCVDQPIFLAASTTSVIDTAFWQITNIFGSVVYTTQNLSDTTTLSIAGDYLVSLLIGNRCGFNTAFSQTITVSPPPQASSLPAGLPICGTSALLEAYDIDPPNIADISFLWSTGETTSSINVATIGTYNLTMTDITSGCITTASVFVGPPFTLDLGPDQNNCEGDPLILDSQANAITYDWFINNNPVPAASDQRTFDFGAQMLGTGVYTVRVEIVDPIDPSCIVVDETIITVNATPSFTATEFSPVTSCAGSDGVMLIDLASTGNFTYTVSGPSPVLATPISGPDNNIQIPNLSAGVYIVTITNNVSSCITQIGNIIITEPVPFNITNVTATPDDCAGGNGEISFDLDAVIGTGNVNWTLRDQGNPANPDITGSAATTGPGDFITIPLLNAGTYSLEVTEIIAGGCTDSEAPIVVAPTPVTDLQIVPTIAVCGLSLDLTPYPISSTSGATFEWSSDGLAFNTIGTFYTIFGSNPVFIKARTDGVTTCDSISSINVTLVPTPTVTIIEDNTDICNGLVTLTANADGGYVGAPLSYRWSTGETTPSIVVNQSSNVNVSVNNQLNLNCFDSDNIGVTIPAPFTVSLASTLACDDGSPFTVSATATNALVDYSWKLNGIELPDITSQIQSITAGVFEVTATDRGVGNCANTATLEVIKAPVTPTDLSSAVVFCPDEGEIILDAGANFISYLWSTGESTQTIMITQGGFYTVDATNNFNCITSDQSQVLEDCIPKVFGPNAFKPGGLNNEYSLFTEYVDEFEIFIYNRWGVQVFQSNDANFTWDGYFEGELLPADQYSWVVRYTSSFRDRGTIEQYGGVVLIR